MFIYMWFEYTLSVLTILYRQVDRVIDEGELQDPTTGENRIYFLVKWNGLFYDASTWESEDDLREVIKIPKNKAKLYAIKDNRAKFYV